MRASNNRLAKLTHEDIEKIMRMHAYCKDLDMQILETKKRIAGEYEFLKKLREDRRKVGQRGIGREMGLDHNLIHCLVRGRTYKHIKRA